MHTTHAPDGRSDLRRLYLERDKVAALVVENPRLAPIFLRYEQEIERIEAATSGDPLSRARAIARQMATR